MLDIGCGPGSITVGLTGKVVGVDLHPVPVVGVAVAGADGLHLPFATGTFDALYLNAVLQHAADAGAVLAEARRVAAPGAVIGVGDTDWGTRIMHPHEPLIARGQQIQELVRGTGSVRIGRELRGSLAAAGFGQIKVTVEGRIAGTSAAVAGMAAFERAWFAAPEAIAYVIDLGIAGRQEMTEIAEAWTRWATDPGACATDCWFNALGWAPSRSE